MALQMQHDAMQISHNQQRIKMHLFIKQELRRLYHQRKHKSIKNQKIQFFTCTKNDKKKETGKNKKNLDEFGIWGVGISGLFFNGLSA